MSITKIGKIKFKINFNRRKLNKIYKNKKILQRKHKIARVQIHKLMFCKITLDQFQDGMIDLSI